MEKIKVIYNWLGPRGPIPNSEIPNLLNLACVTEGASTNSRFFWTDDIWRTIFSKDSLFELSPAWTVTNHTAFIYPCYLGCRIHFSQYFNQGDGLLEHGHCPPHVLHGIRAGRGYLLLEMTDESYLEDMHLDAMHVYLQHLSIPSGKVIYLNGCPNSNEIYDQYCQRKGIPDLVDNRMIMLSLQKSQVNLSMHLRSTPQAEPMIDYDRLPEKRFLSWNRRFKSHRTVIALGLNRLGLIERSYVSMPKVSDENSNQSFMNSLNHELLQMNGFSASQIASFNRKLPLILDDEHDIGEMCSDFNGKARPFYQNSLVSLVTETNFDSHMMTLTEKSFKPFKEKHPFITIAVPGALAKLREMGFKTFGDFWDETYDTIDDHWERAQEILRICGIIGSWNEQQIKEFRQNVKPILEHNYQQVKNDLSIPVVKQLADIVLRGTLRRSSQGIKRCLVLGGGGFIGTHLVNSLVDQGHHVIAADIKAPSWGNNRAHEYVFADLRDIDQVRELMKRDITEVYQLAADMGGAEYVFTGLHDADIMSNSASININVLKAMQEYKVSKVFYSSSACIYPQHNQLDPSNPDCSESSAYPAAPDSEYGWEKLFSERLYMSYARNAGIQVRIARFHNVFGPLGDWQTDRAKAPAALCRKVLESQGEIEIYGDGEQTRSFLYITEAIEGTHRLMASELSEPVNLGSDRMVTINHLVDMICAIAGKQVKVNHIEGPLGVRGRNSNNQLIRAKLGWAPEDLLESGLRETYEWIKSVAQ